MNELFSCPFDAGRMGFLAGLVGVRLCGAVVGRGLSCPTLRRVVACWLRCNRRGKLFRDNRIWAVFGIGAIGMIHVVCILASFEKRCKQAKL